MDSRDEVLKNFKKDTAEHQLTILRNEGVYRHLRCHRNNAFMYRYDIITWPGYLSMTGDMGCYVFSRVPDMFEFFGDGHDINPGYWGEKVEAQDKSEGGIKKFSVDRFRENVKQAARYYYELDDDAVLTTEQLEDIQDVLDADDEWDCISRVRDSNHAMFQDFWEYDNREYGYRYLWALYAILWAIRKYGEATRT